MQWPIILADNYVCGGITCLIGWPNSRRTLLGAPFSHCSLWYPRLKTLKLLESQLTQTLFSGISTLAIEQMKSSICIIIIIIRSPVATIGLLYLSILLREEQPGKLKPRAVGVDPEAICVSFRGHWNLCT